MNEEAQMKALTVAASVVARDRAAIITATLTLLENGNLSPTAKRK